MESELDVELSYEKSERMSDSEKDNLSKNYRNGYSKKTVKTQLGEFEVKVPRDRNGEYEPSVVTQEIVTNETGNPIKRLDYNGRTFIVRKSRCEITKENVYTLQFLELLKDIETYSELQPKSNFPNIFPVNPSQKKRSIIICIFSRIRYTNLYMKWGLAMFLHENKELFEEIIFNTADFCNLPIAIIEKDYYVKQMKLQ